MSLSIGQKMLIGKPIRPSGMIVFGKMLTAVLVQSTMPGTPSIVGMPCWSRCFQSSQLDQPADRSRFCCEYGVIIRLWPLG